MHMDFLQMTLRENRRELDARLVRATLTAPDRQPDVDDVVLRLCTVHDDGALDRLAALEGKPSPQGRHVVAEVSGTVVAALPLLGGSVLADPFRPTAHLVRLLELRARQIEPAGRRGIRLRAAVRNLSPARR